MKRRLNWGFDHSDRPRGRPYLTPAEAAFIAKQRALRASDQAIADMLGRPVSDVSLTVVVDGDPEPPRPGVTVERISTRLPRPKVPTTVWRAPK